MTAKTKDFLSSAIIFLMLMFMVRDVCNVSINPYLITILLSGISCVLSYKNLIAFSCFLLPLSCGIQSFIWIVIIFCILFRKAKIPYNIIFLFLLFFVLELIDQAFTIIIQPEIKNTIFYFASLFLTLYLINDESKSLDHSRNIRYFLYASSFLLLVVFTRVILQFGIDELLTGALRYKLDDVTLSGEYVFYTNANNLGLYSAVSFSILLFIGKDRLKISNYAYILIFAIVVVGGMLTFSRTWLILVIMSLLAYLLFTKQNKAFVLFVMLLMALFTLVLFSDYSKSIYDIFVARLNAEDIKDGAGRTDLFLAYNEFFVENPRYWLTGTGSVYYLSVCRQMNSIHNMLQQTYVCYGILGLIGVLTMFYNILKKASRYVTVRQQYAPLICYLIFVQTVQFFNPIFCMYPLIICVYCLKVNQKAYELC